MDKPAKTLTHYVEEDLRRRIQSGQDLPHHLTLASLSRQYGVSFAPVRSALDTLIQEGLIRKKENNGRIEVNSDKVGTKGSYEPVAIPLKSDDWDRILIKEVMLASLSGTATYLREEALAQKHGTGRSVIRSTFSRFAGAGLIEHIPRRGWRVRPLNLTGNPGTQGAGSRQTPLGPGAPGANAGCQPARRYGRTRQPSS